MNADDLHVEGFYLRPPFEGRAHDGVTVTHVPTGISAKCSSFNSLHKNRSAATIAIAVEMARRAESAPRGDIGDAGDGGRLTPCPVAGSGLEGLRGGLARTGDGAVE